MGKSLLIRQSLSFRPSLDLLWVASIALIWFMFHTVPSDKHSVVTLSLTLLLTLAVGVSGDARPNPRVAGALLTISILLVLGSFSGFMNTGNLNSVRAPILIFLFVLLGITIGLAKRRNTVLYGLGLGTSFVHAQGLIDQYLDQSLFVLSGDYLGASGRESLEMLSALVGLAVGLSLIPGKASKKLFAFMLLILNCFMVWRIDITSGLVAGALMVFIAMVILASEKRPTLVSNRRLIWSSVFLGLVVLALSASRRLTLEVADFFGERVSVEARFEIWDAAVSSVNTLGFLFGHGATFWQEGTKTLTQTSQILERNGFGTFSHAHSMYLDFFLGFGVAGIVVLAVLIYVVCRGTHADISIARIADRRAFSWVLIFGLAVFGASESVLISSPPGWFLGSVLLGFFLQEREQESRTQSFSTDRRS